MANKVEVTYNPQLGYLKTVFTQPLRLPDGGPELFPGAERPGAGGGHLSEKDRTGAR